MQGIVLPHIGEGFPTTGRHQTHTATIVAVDAHGLCSWTIPEPDVVTPAPTVTVRCSCGAEWIEAIPEAVAAA